MKNRIIAFVLTLCLLCGLVVPVAAAAEEKSVYYHVPVRFNDIIGQTLQEDMDFMVRKNIKSGKEKVYIKAEDFANLTSAQCYTFGQTPTECAYVDSENGHVIRYQFGSTNISVYYLGGELSYNGPCEALYEDGVAWIPFDYTMQLFGCSYSFLVGYIKIHCDGTNALAAATSVHNKIQSLSFDWVTEAGMSELGAFATMASATVAVGVSKLLSLKPSNWGQVLSCVTGDTYLFDREYAEQIAEMFIAPSVQEMDMLMAENEATEFSDSWNEVVKGISTNGVDIASEVIEKEHLTANFTVKSFQSVDNFFEAVNKSTQSIQTKWPNIKLDQKIYGLSSKIKGKVTKAAADGMVQKLDDTLKKNGNKVQWTAKGVFFALDMMEYYAKFLNKSERASDALRQYAATSQHKETDVFERYTSEETSDFRKAVETAVCNNFAGFLDDGIPLPIQVKIWSFAWDLITEFAPFISDGLDASESHLLSQYAIRYQNESLDNYYDLRSQCLASNGGSEEDLDKLINGVYAYLKFSYIARNAAAASFNSIGEIPLTDKEQMENNVNQLNKNNEQVAKYLKALEQDPFMPSDSKAYNKEWSSGWDNKIASALCMFGTEATGPITQQTLPSQEITVFPGEDAIKIITEEEAGKLVKKAMGRAYAGVFDAMMDSVYTVDVVDQFAVGDKMTYVLQMTVQGQTQTDYCFFVPVDGTSVWFGMPYEGSYYCYTGIDLLNDSMLSIIGTLEDLYMQALEEANAQNSQGSTAQQPTGQSQEIVVGEPEG